MRFIPVIANDRLFDSGFLRCKDDFVERALFGRESAVHGKSPRDIGGVVVEFTTGIDQEQVTVFQLSVVFNVMQNAGILATTNNRAVRM